MKTMKRRTFLQYSGLTGLSLMLGGLSTILEGCSGHNMTMDMSKHKTPTITLDPRESQNFVNSLRLPGERGPFALFRPSERTFNVSSTSKSLEIVQGKKTKMDIYQVEDQGNQLVNPVIIVEKEQQFSATFTNELKDETIIHWHGLAVRRKMDGHPINAIKSGQSYKYKFKINNRGGTYWYHPHPHERTAAQAYAGLAGLFIIEDENEISLRKALDLKLGITDVPLVIQDKRFDKNGNLEYQLSEMDQMMGFQGNVILANLTVNPFLKVDRRLYRFRILNGSNARIYRLALVKDQKKVPVHLIATDGGLVDKPYKIEEFFISPGERAEILVDFSEHKPDEELFIKSLAFDPMDNESSSNDPDQAKEDIKEENHSQMSENGHDSVQDNSHGEMKDNMVMEMDTSKTEDKQEDKKDMKDMEEMNSNMSTPDDALMYGEEFFVLKLAVQTGSSKQATIPDALSKINPIDLRAIMNRKISLQLENKRWKINGYTFKMDEYPINVKKGCTEVWDITNSRNSMPHPMHLHGFMFQVLERSNSPKQVKEQAIDNLGRTPVDLGWKDTVLVWPGETVRIAVEFTHDFDGDQTYLFHCHNLEHEDQGMMINVRVIGPN